MHCSPASAQKRCQEEGKPGAGYFGGDGLYEQEPAAQSEGVVLFLFVQDSMKTVLTIVEREGEQKM